MDPKIVPVTQLKPKLLKVISRVCELGEEYIVTKKGYPAAVIMSFDEWESWRETLEIMADKKMMKRIQKGKAYFDRGGKGKTMEEVFGKDPA